MNETQLARIEDKIDRPVAGAIAVRAGTGMVPQSMSECMEAAKMLAIAQQAVPKHLRGQPGLCLGIIMQAVSWQMDIFAVAKKSYVVNDNLAYESQLIHAVIEARAPLKKRLRCMYSGEGADRQCTVSGTFVGEDEPHEYTTPKFKDIPIKNSPLWKWDVDQQMFYLGSRAWARKWCPDVLLGVYSPDEAQYAGETAAPVRTVIHNPLEDEADAERPARDVREDIRGPSGAVILEGDEAERALTEPEPDDSAIVHTDGSVTRPGDKNHPTEGAAFRTMDEEVENRMEAARRENERQIREEKALSDNNLTEHDPETGEVFDAKAGTVLTKEEMSARAQAVAHAKDLERRDAEAVTKPAEPPKAAAAASPRARPRPTPRQARAEPAGEPKAETAPKAAPADKTHPEANAALGIAFPQPWIRKTAAEYELYLVQWTVAWFAYGKDPDGLRNRYSAERTIRSGLGEPADHDTLTKWKGIAADVFKKLGGQS